MDLTAFGSWTTRLLVLAWVHVAFAQTSPTRATRVKASVRATKIFQKCVPSLTREMEHLDVSCQHKSGVEVESVAAACQSRSYAKSLISEVCPLTRPKSFIAVKLGESDVLSY